MAPQIDQINALPDDTLLTPVDVARLLACSAQAVRRNIKIGRFKAVQVAGKWYMLGSYLKTQIVHNVNP